MNEKRALDCGGGACDDDAVVLVAEDEDADDTAEPDDVAVDWPDVAEDDDDDAEVLVLAWSTNVFLDASSRLFNLLSTFCWSYCMKASSASVDGIIASNSSISLWTGVADDE